MMILQKTIVREFYRQNIGLLVLIVVFAGAFLSGQEHYTLSKLALQKPIILLFYGVGWTLLTIKSVFFVIRNINQPEYEFLYTIRLLSKQLQFRVLALMQLSLNLIFLIYSLYMCGVALKEHLYLSIINLVVINVLLIFLPLVLYFQAFRKPNSKQSSTSVSFFTPNLPKHFTLFFIRYILNYQPVLFLLTKIFGWFIIVGTCYIYPTDDYDVRLFYISALIIGISGFQFASHYINFESNVFLSYRNLPLSLNKRFQNITIIAILLVFIEIIILIRNAVQLISYLNILSWVFYVISIQVILFSLEYSNHIKNENKGQVLFYSFIACILLIMFKVSVILIGFIFFVVSWIIFNKRYFLFEPNSK